MSAALRKATRSGHLEETVLLLKKTLRHVIHTVVLVFCVLGAKFASAGPILLPPLEYQVIMNCGEVGCLGVEGFAPNGPGTYGVVDGGSAMLSYFPGISMGAEWDGNNGNSNVNVHYYFAVNGPSDNVAVPLLVSFSLTAFAGVPNAQFTATQAGAFLDVTSVASPDVGPGKNVTAFAGGGVLQDESDFSGTLSYSIDAGQVGIITMGAGGLVGCDPEPIQITDVPCLPVDGLAFATADPVISIDPAFLSSNPGYSLAISPDIGNLSAVPEAGTWFLLGTGLVGIFLLRRQKLIGRQVQV